MAENDLTVRRQTSRNLSIRAVTQSVRTEVWKNDAVPKALFSILRSVPPKLLTVGADRIGIPVQTCAYANVLDAEDGRFGEQAEVDDRE